MAIGLQNVSKQTCTLSGYPGVSVVDGSGRQLGPAATRPVNRPTPVQLAPNATGYFQVRTGEPGPSNGQGCTAVGVALRVYPPNNTVSLQVPVAIQICQNFFYVDAVTETNDVPR